MNKVSIVILNWNRKADTIDCLKSIDKLKTKDVRLRIIVVDNGSTDRSIVEIKKQNLKIKDFEIIENGVNLGFAEGNNVGIRAALREKSDYILVLNNDTIVDPLLIAKLIKTAQSSAEIGIVSPKIYFAPGFEFHKDRYKSSEIGRVIWYAGGDIDWDNVYATNHGVDEVDNKQFEEEKDIDFATGACMLVTSKALEEVGFFDRKYYMYLEDADLSLRMRNNGFRVVYCPEAFLWHKVAQSSFIGGGLNDYYLTRNRMLFGLTYAPFKTKQALVRESIKLLIKGRKWQKRGIADYYLGNFGKGSFT